MSTAYRPEYDEVIATGVLRGNNSNTIRDELNETFGTTFTRDQVSGRITRLGLRSDKVAPTPEERFQKAVQTERDKASDRILAREMAVAVKAQARWDEFLDIVRDELAGAPQRDVMPLIVPAGSGTPEIFTQLIGDVHAGKFVDPGVVGGEFGYSSQILVDRMARLLNRMTRLFTLHSNTAPFSSFRLYFLGDGVDGVDMRRGHAHRVDIQSATGQLLFFVRQFEWLIRQLSQLGIPIEVVWDFGNHGRVGDFGVNLPADNWDYLAGEMLKLAVRDLEAVTIDVTTLKYHLTTLGPMNVYSSHGDAIKGGDGFAGIPINGLARGQAKDTGLHQQLFDLYLTAHFHTLQQLRTQTGLIIQNGSWDGGDDYSVNALKVASEPVQLAFGVHPTRGITWKQEIALAPAWRQPTPATEF